MKQNILKTSAYLLLLISFVCFTENAFGQEKTKFTSIEDALFAGRNLSGGSGPRNVIWINDGKQYSYIAQNEETRASEIRSYDPKTKKDNLIFSAADFKTPGTDDPFKYSSFQWTKDSKFLVFQSNFRPIYRRSGISDYYYYNVATKKLNVLIKDAMTAELSPDGSKVGFEREGDLFVYDLASNTETRLTNSGDKNFYNGRYGWVYEEEFGLAQAWNWSHDSKYIAFWQTDEREVELFKSTDYSGTYPEYVEIPYPKVGSKNPVIKMGVVDVTSGKQQWLNIDMQDGYVPRIYWTAIPGKLAVVWLNREQNHLKLFFFDVTSGKGNLIMEETNEKGWIDVFDFFAGVNHYFFFPETTKEFFWISERDGWSHIYRYDYTGKLLNQVTKGEWEVTNIFAINPDTKTIYFASTEVSPVERHLFSVTFDGKKKKKMTDYPGTHSIIMGPKGDYYIDSYSNIHTPRQVELWTSSGKMLKKLEDNARVLEYIKTHDYSPAELFTFTTSDGQTLDGNFIRPMDFDSTKSYPLILNIYGGPGSQGVYNSWESSGWSQWLAQNGYVIANVNNRGNGGYGGDFEKIVYKKLGYWEAHDFDETAQYLAHTYTWVDSARVGIRGHSYGGYMSAYAILTHPNIFKVAIVTAPLTDWRLYDTIYAERYMGLLSDNEDSYIKSSVQTYANQLKGKMLLSHASMDENVHLQNTMQLVWAFIDNGKDIDLRIYPPGTHGVAYSKTSYVLLYDTYTKYLDQYLK